MNFVNFEERQLEIIFKVLDFTKTTIEGHYASLAVSVDSSVRKPIIDEMDEATRPIEDTVDFFKKNSSQTFISINDRDFSYFMDTIRSALEIWQQHLKEAQETTGINGYSDLIKQVEDVSNLGGPSKGRKDIFSKYYVERIQTNKKVKVFISYQDKDVEIACQLRKLLMSNSSKITDGDIFVAHRDIPLTEEWRKTVIGQLENSSHLIALCTENYICSAFGNQEVGYAMAKGAKIVSLFWEGTDRKRYGFLEGFQALPEPVNEKTLEKAVTQVLKKLSLY